MFPPLQSPKFVRQIIYEIIARPQSFNEIFRGYEQRTGKKLEVTYRSLESLRQKVAENPYDFDADLHLNWATDGLVGVPDNGLYPGWNPTKVVDIVANL